MSKRKIAYATFWSPWKSAAVKVWQHHDAVLKYLCREYNAEVECVIPPSGGNYLKAVLDGNRSRLMTSIAELPINFHWDVYEGDFDCLLLELGDLYPVARNSEKERDRLVKLGLPDGSTPAEIIAEGVEKLIKRAVEEGKPIIWYDPDLYLINGSYNNVSSRVEGGIIAGFGKMMYDKYFHISKSTLMSSMKKHPVEDCVFVPFNIDPEKLPERIKPLSERTCVSRYVGNNYGRENYLPLFNEASKYGVSEVYGVGWTKFKDKYPNVRFYPKASLTEERASEFYSDSVLGLFGCNQKWTSHEHHTLRIREFLMGGTFIIPENNHIKENLLVDKFPITSDDILKGYLIQELLKLSDREYEDLVLKQQQLALKKFDCRLYVPLYAKAFGWEVR